MTLILAILVFGPLLGATVAGLFGRRIGDTASMAVTTGLLFLSCALAWTTFGRVAFGDWAGHHVIRWAPFIEVGDFRSAWAVRLDTLSAVMLIVVTTVSALVHLYSWGYMADDPSKPRFFAYLSLFTFAMLMLVTAADFMQLFFGWEGVGLASYLLIGFWFKKPTANAASIKAFVVNRVGDFGFALGIMTIFWQFGTIDFATLFPQIAGHVGRSWGFAGGTWSALDLAGVLLLIGAMGKSAQFFLHTWLPDAMEGPTPVSALIHAATMVTAGVYMLCLLSPLYEHAPVARNFIIVVGAVTSLFAATVGMAQNDIKRVIAYSTCSQLGYMFFAAGVGAYQAAMFHLFTHAFFKALLFLGAGSVIHGMHHEQDMRRMGGLARFLPITFAAMTVGNIAITGLGIPGVGGFSGFYSKDAILETAFANGQAGNSLGYFGYIIGTFVAGLTAFYSWRLAFMTFNGPKHWEQAHADQGQHASAAAHSDHATAAQHETHSEPDTNSGAADHGDDHHGVDAHHPPHESPWTMLVPLVVLSIGAIAAGFVFMPYFVGEGQAEFWRGSIFTGPGNRVLEEREHLVSWAPNLPLVAAVIGTLVAAYYYLWKIGLAKRIAERRGPLYTFFYNKWFFDELYQATFVRGAKGLGDLLWKRGDVATIDKLGPNGFAWMSARFAGVLGRFQSGLIYHYAFVMLLGLAGLLTYALMAWARCGEADMTGILSVITYLPLVGALAVLLAGGLGGKRVDAAATQFNVKLIALVTTLATFALSVVMVARFDTANPGFQFEEAQTWFAGASYRMGVDGISVLLVLLTTFLMPICVLAGWSTINERVVEYFIAFLVLETLMVGTFCALDLILFYIFFEFGLIPMFIIIGVWGGKNRIYAAYKFFLYTLLGSVLMLAAILAMAGIAGTTSIPELLRHHFDPNLQLFLWLAFFASFAVKMPMWPVHTWLPDAHVEAPTAGSVILAGVLLKLGGYGFMRFSLPMFPDASHAFQPLVFALSVTAIVWASLVAFRQTDIKKLIAYSSVAHMGFVTMGIFSGNLQGEQGALYQMLSHGVISGALFLCVGVVYDRMHTREIAFYGGLVNRMPVYAAVFLLFTMGNVGLPGTSGFIGEMLTMVGVYGASTMTALIACTGVILSAVYALTLYRRVALGEMTNPALAAITDMDAREWVIFAPLVVGTLVLGVYPHLITDVTAASAGRLVDAWRSGAGR